MSADLQCPECGHIDLVPEVYQGRERVIERVRIWFGRASSRKVGKVMRCSHCLIELCVGPQGVYQPRIRPPAKRKANGQDEVDEEPRSLRDPDQPWDR